MAIGDDFSVNTAGDIRHESGTSTYTVLELHRWLQDLADNASTAGASDDVLDITSDTPSERSTNDIITLLGTYNINDAAAEFLYGGSITQGSGATETIYSGLKVLGSVVSADTQIQVVQDKVLYDGDAPFWGDQTSAFNGGGNVLMRILVKSREWGCDIDQKNIIVQARNYGDSYSFFNVTLGTGEAVAALGTVDDPQNDTAEGTVTAYTHVVNSGTVLVDAQDETSYDNSPTSEGTFNGGSGYNTADTITLEDGTIITVDNHSTGTVTEFTVDASGCTGAASAEQLDQVSTSGSGTGFYLTPDTDNVEIDEDRPVGGFQQIDIEDGNGDQPYYSKWTYGADTSGDQLKAVWEFAKDLTKTGTAKHVAGVDGELYKGITHTYSYDGLTGTFREGETVVWGTQITYDTLAGGTFTVGNYVRIGANGAAGRIMWDNGSTSMIVALEDTSKSLKDLVDAQDETSYDNSPTTEGTFSGGSDYEANDVITLSCGCEITVDNHSTGTVTEFTVSNTNCTGAFSGVQLTQSSTDGSGTGFTLTPGDDNVAVQTDEETITEYQMGEGNGATGVTADINVTVTDNDKEGGSGLLLANDTTGTKHHIMLCTGAAPVDNSYIYGFSSGADCDVNGSVTGQTVTPVFIGSFVGSLIGGFGLGVDKDDLSFPDTVTDLDGDVNSAPNNVTWYLYGLVIGDRVLVGPKDTGDAFDFDQMTLNTGLNSTTTIVDVGTGNIPDNTPTSGVLRITLDDGRIKRVPYTSHDGDDEFTIPSTDFTDPEDAIATNGVMLAYLDLAATSSTESYTVKYESAQDLRVRVRDGGGTPIKTYEANSSLGSTGGSATASRISDA